MITGTSVKLEPLLDSSAGSNIKAVLKSRYMTDVLPSICSNLLQTNSTDNVTLWCGIDRGQVTVSAVLLAAISPWCRSLMEQTLQNEEYHLVLPSLRSDELCRYLESCCSISTPQMDLLLSGSVHSLLLPSNYTINRQQETVTSVKEEQKLQLIDNNENWTKDDHMFDNYVELLTGKEGEDNPSKQRLKRKAVDDEDDDVEWGNTATDQSTQNYSNGLNGEEEDDVEENGPKRKRGRPKKPKLDGEEKRAKEKRKEKLPTLMCQDCGKVYKNNHKNDRHKYDNHVAKHRVEKFSCECNVEFTSFVERERHMKVEHMGWFGCPECVMCFKSKDVQEKHSEGHGQICDMCGYIGKTQANLNEHRKRVHERNIVQCDECEKLFMNDQRLMHHKRKAHTPQQCPYCGEIFKSLRVHLNTVHKTDAEKKYQCVDCGKGFCDKNKLESHRMSIHIKSRPHRCRYGCDIGYNDVSNRNSHEKKKHGGLFSTILKHDLDGQ